MKIEMYLIILMFAVSLSAYVTATNARGTARTVLSHLFASLILLAAVYSLFRFMISEKEAEKTAERDRYEKQLKLAEEEARLAAEQQQVAPTVDLKKIKADLTAIITKGSEVARAIYATDVENEEADYDQVVRRANGLKAQAMAVKQEFGQIQLGDAEKDFGEAKKAIEGALNNLAAAGNYLGLYFKSEDESEEDERYDLFRRNANAAKSNFASALSKLEGK